MAYRLQPAESLAAGLRRVVVEQAAAAAAHLAATDDPSGAVHEARKRSKEARAALRLLRGSLGDDARRAARTAFRDTARKVAAIRDAEAALPTLEKLRHSQRLLRSERLAAEAALRERQAAARAALTVELRRDVAAGFAAAIEQLPEIHYAAPDVVAAALARVYRRGRRAMRAAGASGREEDYHRWRHETKDLWYAVRLFQEAWSRPLGALADELQDLSQLLGDEHDLTVLRATLADSAPSPLTPRVERAVARRQQRLRQRAHAAGERVWAERPRAFAARILGYWAKRHRAATHRGSGK